MTVLLAVHDGEPHVRQCVESVLGQSFTDFELLIVDDASTDGTPAAIAAYADPRVRLLGNGSNLGQVPSLNRGLREARGEYVARIDHDDWCRPQRLERQVAVLDAEPRVGLVGTWMEAIDKRGRRLGWLRETLDGFADFVFHTLIMRVYISHPSAMYRRDPVLRLGGYDESTAPAEDKDLWRKLLLERWDARIVTSPLVAYRLHDAQLSQTRAAYQREVDGRSQERFLTELDPEAPAHTLRVLLANDAAFWGERREQAGVLAALERLLAAACGRLQLDERERLRLEQLVAGQLLRVARTRPWRRESPALAAWGLQRTSRERRGAAIGAHAASLALAPPRCAGRSALRALSDATEGMPRVQALRAAAKRSRAARLLYGKLVGGN
ncbi:MAG: glycosyltransferase family 2 protein [Gaiellaceae bacterium]